MSKEEKEKYEEKAKKVAEEQQAKQQEAERAFNESLNRSQSPWDGGRASPGSSSRPITPGGKSPCPNQLPESLGQRMSIPMIRHCLYQAVHVDLCFHLRR